MGEPERMFYWAASHRSDILGYIMLGLYCENGNTTTGEMRIEWEQLDNRWTPRLKVYDDAWKVLATFGDVLAKLAELDNLDAAPQRVADVLMTCGFRDVTDDRWPTIPVSNLINPQETT